MRKLMLALIMAAMTFTLPAYANAAENVYYLVEGYVTESDDNGFITRVELVEDISKVAFTPGDTFAICTYDQYGERLNSYGFSTSFETAPDLPFAELSESLFSVLIPYSEDIDSFCLEDMHYYIDYRFISDTFQGEISQFDIEETDTGFTLYWDVDVFGEDFSALDFDIYAVSLDSGEKNTLAYRIKEKELSIPYEWLEPNDPFVFVLKSNDGYTTLTAESDVYNAPDGAAKDVLYTEEWLDDGNTYEDGGGISLIIIIGVVVVVAAVAFVLIKKRPKPGSNKQSNNK